MFCLALGLVVLSLPGLVDARCLATSPSAITSSNTSPLAFLDAFAYRAAYFLVISYLADMVNPDSFIDHPAHISRAKTR